MNQRQPGFNPSVSLYACRNGHHRLESSGGCCIDCRKQGKRVAVEAEFVPLRSLDLGLQAEYVELWPEDASLVAEVRVA